MSLEKFFHLKENNTTVKTEIMAGVTSFMTMAYILAVNPNILAAAGMDHGAVFTATAVASFIGTLCMALFANYPFALAPGMGLNAYFAYTVVLGMGYSWKLLLRQFSRKVSSLSSCPASTSEKRFSTRSRLT